MTRTVCVVTGSRAEYGLLRWVMHGIAEAADLTLQLVVTGSHLSPEFGLTYQQIEQDGFTIDRRVEMLLSSDTAAGITKSMGLGLIGFADAFAELRPDVVLIVGDRFEMLSVAAAALMARIPLAHAHGGETTEGALDESIRHAITKLSHLHFVAAEPYRRRVLQLGEDPGRVFLVGGLGVDNIRRLDLLDRGALAAALGVELRPRMLLVTYHPPTLADRPATEQLRALLESLRRLEDTTLIITTPNADAEGRALRSMLEEFVAHEDAAHLYDSLGQLLYLSCMRHADAVVGNSSSGLIEAPALGKPTIDIGDRQRGRVSAGSVIHCEPESSAISAALERINDPAFRRALADVTSPYGTGGASDEVVRRLRSVPLDDILVKPFHDVQEHD
jgi:GDP/UDP-N,N'-diacetylbacillosamine 2-epimerase (hydrolysing)